MVTGYSNEKVYPMQVGRYKLELKTRQTRFGERFYLEYGLILTDCEGEKSPKELVAIQNGLMLKNGEFILSSGLEESADALRVKLIEHIQRNPGIYLESLLDKKV